MPCRKDDGKIKNIPVPLEFYVIICYHGLAKNKESKVMTMKTGMCIFGGIPHEKLAVLLRENEIYSTFIGSETENFDEVMKIYTDNGITVETLHAPFNKINDMWGDDDEAGEAILARLFNSVDTCAKYSIPVTIIHVSSGRPMPEISGKGIARYENLFRYAEEKGVKVALENLRYLENLKYFMDRYDTPVFCWDTGHESCYTDGIHHMEYFGERLGALHIHDNRGEKDCDDHLLPYDSNIDFESVARYIAKSPFDGTIMLEVCRKAAPDGKEFYADLSDEQYVKRAADAVRRLAVRVEEIREKWI